MIDKARDGGERGLRSCPCRIHSARNFDLSESDPKLREYFQALTDVSGAENMGVNRIDLSRSVFECRSLTRPADTFRQHETIKVDRDNV